MRHLHKLSAKENPANDGKSILSVHLAASQLGAMSALFSCKKQTFDFIAFNCQPCQDKKKKKIMQTQKAKFFPNKI